MTELLTAILKDDAGRTLGAVVLNPLQFSTGSMGYHGAVKMTIDGFRYQVQCQAVRIGSKPSSDNPEG